jgi:hypothetical protein
MLSQSKLCVSGATRLINTPMAQVGPYPQTVPVQCDAEPTQPNGSTGQCERIDFAIQVGCSYEGTQSARDQIGFDSKLDHIVTDLDSTIP